MANPVVLSCPSGEWVLAAEGVTSGYIHPLDAVQFLHTYRTTGGAAPTATTEGVPLPALGAAISALSAIDVYLYCTGPDAARVRVDK